MRKRGRRFTARPPRLAMGCISRFERSKRVDEVARPMRELFDLLATGEAYEIDGQVVMRMPDVDALSEVEPDADWVALAPAMLGWIDCWKRLAPDLRLQQMQYLADRLAADKSITPRLVEQAREEFEQTITRLHVIGDGAIERAITDTQIAWEFERLKGNDPGKRTGKSASF